MKMNEPQISIDDITSDILLQLPDDKPVRVIPSEVVECSLQDRFGGGWWC